MKHTRKFLVLILALVLSFAIVGCNGDATTTTTTTSSDTQTTTTTGPQNPMDALPGSYFAYNFYAEGYGEFTSYFHFYEEDPVLGSVFYFGGTNNQQNIAGTYTVAEEDYDYEVAFGREQDLETGTVPYTITFYDWEGTELTTLGYDEDYVYNDSEHPNFAIYGASEQAYGVEDPETSDYVTTFEGEAGVPYLELVDPDDSIATLTLNHNKTYVDLMGEFIVEGTWSIEENASGGYDYTLTPNYSTDTGAVLSVSGDESTISYTPDGGTAVDVVFVEEETVEEKEILFSFTGTYTELDLHPDNTFTFSYEASDIYETGTWDWDGTTLTLTKSDDEVITATIDSETDVMSLTYTAVASDQLVDTFTAEASVWQDPLANSLAEVLFSFSGGYTTLDIYDDGTFVFEFADQDLTEEGTWDWDINTETLTLTQSDDTTIASTIDSESEVMTIEYVAVVSDQLVDTFTAEASVWQAALPQLLFSFTGGMSTLDILSDGTYVFEYSDYGIVEIGTWNWDESTETFEITQSNDNVIVATIDASDVMTLDYVAVVNDQLTDTFTADSSVWQDALDYTPAT